MATQFKGKTVFVTGAGLGIGFGICEAFAAAGATVALNDIDGELAQSASAKINQTVGSERVRPVPFDVSDAETTQKLITTFAEEHGRLDIMVANAGITLLGRFLDYSVADFDQVTGVNLRGTYFSSQAAARFMIDAGQQNARIILTSSVTGVRAFKSMGTYGMTKAGIIHLARTLAVELGENGITVNSVSPGAIVTERNLQYDPAYADHWALVTPNGRTGTVADIVNVVLFLASPESQHITGQTIQVDGGWALSSPIPEGHPE